MPGKIEDEDTPEKMQHPYHRESFTDTFSRAFTEMDFVGQEKVRQYSWYAQIVTTVSKIARLSKIDMRSLPVFRS